MLRVGIIGMGYMGRTHYGALRHIPGAEVSAVTHLSAQEIREAYPDLPVFLTWNEMFRRCPLEAVIVAAPTFLHEECVVEAAKAGCDILCEKPFALDAASAERMLEVAERQRVILMVGQVLRFWPHYRRIKELVDAGALGAIQSISAYRLSKLPPWSSWFADPQKSGGCLLDLQVHDVDFVHWILGHPALVRTIGIRSEAGSWDHVWTTLGYGDRVASIEASYLMPASWPFSSGIRLQGARSCIEYTFGVRGNINEREEGHHQFVLYGADGAPTTLEVPPEDAFVNELRYFLNCVRSRQKPELCPTEESLELMRVMDASRRSVESCEAVRLSGDYSRRTS
jgi:predicted dehydrogenase